MSNYNLERGQELYFIELNKLAASNSDLAEDILKLGALFGINVGVMQEKSHSTTFNFDDETCMLSYDWTPSYKKLSSAVYHVANLNANAEEKMSYRQMIEQVFEYYPKHVSFNELTKVKTEKEIVHDSSYKEILSNSEEVFNLTEADDLDGKTKEVPVKIEFDDKEVDQTAKDDSSELNADLAKTAKGEVISFTIEDKKYSMWVNTYKKESRHPDYQIFEDTYVMPPKEVQTNNQESIPIHDNSYLT